MKLSDPVLNEVFIEWAGWQTLVETVMPGRTQARDVDPLTVHDTLSHLSVEEWGRLAHMMIARGHADTIDEAMSLLGSLVGYASVGRRPRYGAEAGLTLDEYMDHRS